MRVNWTVLVLGVVVLVLALCYGINLGTNYANHLFYR
jgi:preprotein translocase subunit SecE